jgi:DNA-binding transcriptional LysR family regulator
LTEAGELFLEEARDILARADRAAMIARRVGHRDGGRLRVAVGYCMNQMALVHAVSLFSTSHQKIRVELQTMGVPFQVAALRDGRIDVGFVRSPVTESALTSEVLIGEPLMLAMPRTHRLAGEQTIRLSGLAREPFVLTTREHVPVYHDIVLRTCREAGFVPIAPHEADHLHMLLGFVAAGCGVALVPAFAQRMRPHNVVFASLRPASPTLQTVVAWRQDHSSVMLTEFVAAVRRALLRPPLRAAARLAEKSRGRKRRE